MTDPRLVADHNECDCKFFFVPVVADGPWWSATSRTLSVTGLLGFRVLVGLGLGFTVYGFRERMLVTVCVLAFIWIRFFRV